MAVLSKQSKDLLTAPLSEKGSLILLSASMPLLSAAPLVYTSNSKEEDSMNRYQMLLGSEAREPQAAAGWRLTRLLPPSGLFGANGMIFGPDGRLYVTQAFGSQITAVNTASGGLEVISPLGGPIVAPDHIGFDSHGTMYVTEVMGARVCARTPDGKYVLSRIISPARRGRDRSSRPCLHR
jgi:sugar lactone lactonase YvrE